MEDMGDNCCPILETRQLRSRRYRRCQGRAVAGRQLSGARDTCTHRRAAALPCSRAAEVASRSRGAGTRHLLPPVKSNLSIIQAKIIRLHKLATSDKQKLNFHYV